MLAGGPSPVHRQIASNRPSCRTLLLAAVSTTALALAMAAKPVSAKPVVDPGILVIGDSQLSFGSGPAFLDFFDNFASSCRGTGITSARLKQVDRLSVGMIGVRSTSLQSWTSVKGAARNRLCVKDKTWGVNASVHGALRRTKRKYVQIGEEKRFNFCRAGRPAFQQMFGTEKYAPRLLVLQLLGNGAGRLANNSGAALADVRRMEQQIPAGLACVYMTTVPTYTSRRNALRVKAQTNLRRALEKSGSRCRFVPGLTTKTLARIQGNRAYFRRKRSGRVKDPFHANDPGAKKFLSLRRRDLCHAVVNALQTRPRTGPGAPSASSRPPLLLSSRHRSMPLPVRAPTLLAAASHPIEPPAVQTMLRPAIRPVPQTLIAQPRTRNAAVEVAGVHHGPGRPERGTGAERPAGAPVESFDPDHAKTATALAPHRAVKDGPCVSMGTQLTHSPIRAAQRIGAQSHIQLARVSADTACQSVAGFSLATWTAIELDAARFPLARPLARPLAHARAVMTTNNPAQSPESGVMSPAAFSAGPDRSAPRSGAATATDGIAEKGDMT